MSEQDQYSKTEAPTPRRREKAREDGDVAFSTELMVGTMMLAATAGFWFGGPKLADQLLQSIRSQLIHLPYASWGSEETGILMTVMVWKFIGAIGLVCGVVYGATLLVGGSQAGFRLALKPLQPDLKRLNPSQGWSRLFSQQNVVKGILSVVKTSLFVIIIYWVLKDTRGQIESAGRGTLLAAVQLGWSLSLQLFFAIAMALMIAGLADYLFQRWRFENKLRMSRQEIKEEAKDLEGDPQVRARIKRLQREFSKNRMLADVPTATVILTNPTHIAIALKYERSTMAAPQVVAKATGTVAKQIVKIAKRNGIPVLERKPLARMLYKTVEVGQEIPPALYQAIAEIVAYLYRLGRVA